MDRLEWIAKASNEAFVTDVIIEYIDSRRYFSLDKKHFVRELVLVLMCFHIDLQNEHL